MTRVGKLSQGPDRRAEAVEFGWREPVRLVRTPKIDELAEQLVNDRRRDRRVDSWLDLDVAAIEATAYGGPFSQLGASARRAEAKSPRHHRSIRSSA
jgi:hypothetical protein